MTGGEIIKEIKKILSRIERISSRVYSEYSYLLQPAQPGGIALLVIDTLSKAELNDVLNELLEAKEVTDLFYDAVTDPRKLKGKI